MTAAASAWREPRAWRFGAVFRQGDAQGVEWVLKRNCSISPRQLLAFYVSLCAVSLGIASVFWAHGATLVMPFAWAELIGMGAALWVYARHAVDRERIALVAGRLTVERSVAGRLEQVVFEPEWLRVELQGGDDALVELTGQGQRIAVGRHVRAEWRPDLAEELRAALSGGGPSGQGPQQGMSDGN
mgnify:CR=1 FL=1